MTEVTKSQLVRRLSRGLALSPEPEGLDRSICEQVLADALELSPRPQTLRELLEAVERGPRHRDLAAVELVAELRRRTRATPDLPLEQLEG